MKRPTIERYGNGWRVEIYPRCYLKWWVEGRAEGSILVIESDCPTLRRLSQADNDRAEIAIKELPQ